MISKAPAKVCEKCGEVARESDYRATGIERGRVYDSYTCYACACVFVVYYP